MGYHARLSPSSADRWTSCSASIGAQEGRVDKGTEAARQGTCCHQMSAEILTDDVDPQSYLGRTMVFWVHDGSDSSGEDWEEAFSDGNYDPTLDFVHEVVVTQEMIDAVVSATNYVLDSFALTGGTMEVEQRVPVGHFTGEVKHWVDAQGRECPEDGPGRTPVWATGSSDVIVMTHDTIAIKDFKFGRHKVDAYDVLVPARDDPFEPGAITPEVRRINLQMGCYALGSLEKFGLLYDFKWVTVEIIQPFMNHLSSYTCSIEELLEWREWLRARAEETRSNPVFRPGFEACHFCKASGDCAAQIEFVLSTTLEGFENVDEARPAPIRVNQLGSLYAACDMIRDCCSAIETRTFEALKAGQVVMRNDGLAYKLVAGRSGHRQWKDEAAAEETLLGMYLKPDQIYTPRKVLSPAQIEPLSKPKRKDRRIVEPAVLDAVEWACLTTLIHQSEGQPAVALETDPRPAIGGAADDFGVVPDSDVQDLF